jgi:hypothetical protein
VRAISVIGPSNYLSDRKSAVQRSVNWYPMLTEGPGEDAQLVLESAPGLELVHTFSGAVRGMRNADGRLFVVAGEHLHEVLGTSVAQLGYVGGGGHVSMTNGTDQLCVVNGQNGYVMNMTTDVVTRITSEGWRGSNTVDFLDGYFVFAAPNTEQFYISAIDDATSLDALEFTSADTLPDKIVSLIVIRRELYLLGARSIEVWINSGHPDFPFARYQGTPIDVGVVGQRAFCNANDSLVWVGQTLRGGPYVYTLNGYQPIRISTQAVEQQLAKSTDITQASLWTYQEAGGEFVALNAPGMASTWVWDAASKLWHERAELSEGEFVRSRVEYVASIGGVQYAADDTKLYTMSRDYHTLAGDDLVRERTWPHLVGAEFESVAYHSLELRCTTGDEPEGFITLEVSNDGGAVWGSPLRRTLGATGRRQQRVRWMPLGTCPAGGSRVHRIRCSSPVQLTIQGAVIA